MSTCLKLSNQVEINGETLVLCSYPRVVEILGNNFNQIVNTFRDFKEKNENTFNLPSYNVNAARRALKQSAQSAYHEVSLSWDSLFASHISKNIIMRVFGENYDLTKFNHPGGPIALQLGKDRDATALFVAHHPFTSQKKLESILKKYKYDGDVQLLSSNEENVDIFDWNIPTNNNNNDHKNTDGDNDSAADSPSKEDQFVFELKSKVKEYFQKEATRRGISLLEATKATPRRWIEMISFFILFVGTIPFYVQGYYLSVILLPIFAWLTAAAVTHDAMHFAVSTNWKINALFGYCSPWTTSPLMWYHQHVIGHHAYPNIPFRDPDLAHAPAFIRLHDSIRWKPLHRFQLFSVSVVWTLGAALYMTLVPLKALYMGALNRSVILMKLSSTRTILHILGRILTATLLWGWQWYVFSGDIPRQIIFTVLPMLINSLCFMISTQMNHLTTENIDRSSRNYYVHQILTSHSFSRTSQLVFWFTGGLNLQIEHHLFPTVNHCHLKYLSPIVVDLCAKYDIPYHESSSVLEAVSKHFQHVVKMSKSKIKAN